MPSPSSPSTASILRSANLGRSLLDAKSHNSQLSLYDLYFLSGNPHAARLAGIDITNSYPELDQGFYSADSRIYHLFEEMCEKDLKIPGLLDARRAAVLRRERSLEPGDDSAEAIRIRDFVQAVLDSLHGNGLEGLLSDLLDCVPRGISIVELTWAPTSKINDFDLEGFGFRNSDFVIPLKAEQRFPAHFRFDRHWNAYLATDTLGTFQNSSQLSTNNSQLQTAINPLKLAVAHFSPRFANPYGNGLLNQLKWYYHFKRTIIMAYLRATDRAGLPTTVGTYPGDYNETTASQFLEVLTNIAADSCLAIPDTWKVEELFKSSVTGDFGQGFHTLLGYLDDHMGILICGSTLVTTEGSSGSRALGEVHKEVRDEKIQPDALLVAHVINTRIIRPIVRLNFGPAAPVPVFTIDVAGEEDLKSLSETYRTLSNSGLAIPMQHAYDRFKIPVPTQGEPVLQYDDANILQYHLQYGILTVNEVRAKLNLPPVAWGNQPANVLLQSGEADTPTPPTPKPSPVEPLKSSAAIGSYTPAPEDPAEPSNDPNPNSKSKSKSQSKSKSEFSESAFAAFAEEAHDYASTQINLPEYLAKDFANFPLPSDIVIEREEHPHITVKYGILSNDLAPVARIIAATPRFEIEFGKTVVFTGHPEHDVLVVDVISEPLHKLNARIAANAETINTYPTYRPHATIAYLKKGTAEQFAGNQLFDGRGDFIDVIHFSRTDGEQFPIALSNNGPSDPARPGANFSDPLKKNADPSPLILPHDQTHQYFGGPSQLLTPAQPHASFAESSPNLSLASRATSTLAAVATGHARAHLAQAIKLAKSRASDKIRSSTPKSFDDLAMDIGVHQNIIDEMENKSADDIPTPYFEVNYLNPAHLGDAILAAFALNTALEYQRLAPSINRFNAAQSTSTQQFSESSVSDFDIRASNIPPAAAFAEGNTAAGWLPTVQAFLSRTVLNARDFESILTALDAAAAAGALPDLFAARQQAYAASFTLVRESNQVITAKIADALASAASAQTSLADFVADVDDLYRSLGLSPQSGNYLELVYDNAINRAAQHARDAISHEMPIPGALPGSDSPVSDFDIRASNIPKPKPWVWGYEWIHGDSSRPRPTHLAMNHFIAPASHPAWATFTPPPIAHGCSCARYTIGFTEAQSLGLVAPNADIADQSTWNPTQTEPSLVSDFDIRYSNFPAPKLTPEILDRIDLKPADRAALLGLPATDALALIPGDRFERSNFDIPNRPFINPSYLAALNPKQLETYAGLPLARIIDDPFIPRATLLPAPIPDNPNDPFPFSESKS